MFVFAEERLSRDRVLGLLTGFAGVVLVLGPWRGLGHGELVGHLACAVAAVCYGLAWPYVRRHLIPRADSAIALAAGQLLCATAILALAAPLATGLPTAKLGIDGIGSLLSLGVLGSGVAYALNYSIIRAAGSAVGSTVTYLIPVFSTLLGVIVLGEALSWNQPAGAIMLLLGVAFASGTTSALSDASGARQRLPWRRLKHAGDAGGSASPRRSRRPRRLRRNTTG